LLSEADRRSAIDWTPDNAPLYCFSVVDANSGADLAIIDFEAQRDGYHSMSWMVAIPFGQIIKFKVADILGNNSTTAAYTVNQSSDFSCFQPLLAAPQRASSL
jgi:hypothetical protein